MNSAPDIASPLGFLASGGEMAGRIREFDWSAHPLGPPERWPKSLKIVVRIMLTSRYAMWMGWGPEFFFFCNDAYAPTLGIKRDSSLGLSARKVWEEIWSDIGPRAESVVRTGEATWDESLLLFLERSGYPEETYHTFSYSPVPHDDGTIGGMLCVVTEETDRVIGERRLAFLRDLGADLASIQAEEEIFRAVETRLTGNSQDLPFALIYLFAADGRSAQLAGAHHVADGTPLAPATIVLDDDEVWPASQLFESDATVPVHDLAARFAGLPCDPWDKPPRDALLVPIAQQGQERPAGFLVAGLNPYRPLDADYRGFLDLLAGQLAAGLGSARAYDAERKRAEALAEIDRAKTAFFSNVSHEFRTPLTLLLGPLEELAKTPEGGLSGNQRQLAEVAHRNGLRLLKLVNTLLNFSRIEAGRERARFELVDLAAFTAELASSFRSAMEKAGLNFVVECPALGEPFHIDREMWEKIVLNLLSNAFKFTLDGEVRVELRRTDAGAELTVRDTGTGIPPEAQAHLFERFYRVQGVHGRTHEGSGIGLALVHELVKLHGGTVRAESEPGRGSAFIVTIPRGAAHLPAAQRAAPPATHAKGNAATAFVTEALRWLPGSKEATDPDAAGAETGVAFPSGQRPRVLLADDNADMREYIARLLSPSCEVISVPDGQAALEAALGERPDLVLTDVMMPRLDGFGLLRAMRADAALQSVPIILLSARAGEEARVEGLEAGADDYLIKPFQSRELLAKVNGTLALAKVRAEAMEREAMLKAERTEILESMNLAFMAMDGEFRIVYLNAEASRMDGMTPEKYIGRNHWEAFPAANGTPIETNYRRAMTERVPVRFENFYEPWQQWFEINAYPMSGGGLGVFFRDITERKRAGEALRGSEERLRLATDSAGLGIWMWQPATDEVVWENDWPYEILDIPREGKAINAARFAAEIVHPEDRAAFERAVADTLQNEANFHFKGRLRRPDGEVRWIEFAGRRMLAPEGTPATLIGIAQNVTERERAEAGLRQNAILFSTLVEQAPMGTYVVDAEFRLQQVNAEAMPAFASVQPLIGRDFQEVMEILWGPEVGGQCADIFRHTLATGERYISPPFTEKRHDLGIEQTYEWQTQRVTLPDGQHGVVCYFNDVTERARAAAALWASQERMRLAAEATGVGIWEWNLLTNTIRWDAVLFAIYGIDPTPDGIVHYSDWSGALLPEDLAENEAILQDTVRRCGQSTRIFRIRRRNDGECRHVEAVETVRVNAQGQAEMVVGTNLDVTERCLFDASLQQARDAAEAANMAKDRFLAVLSHELRTPLTPVLMAVSALEHDPDLRPDVREDLVMIKRNIELETKLIDDLLDLSRITSGKVELKSEAVDLNEAVRQVCGICRPQLVEKDVRLEMALGGQACQISADPARLQQVLWNVLKNAVKFTPAQGTVRVSTARLDQDRCEVRVQDTGIGIPPEVLPKIFNAFEQGDAHITRQFGGLGLGLAISRALVELHGGAIRAESAGPGCGATFIIELPARSPSSATPSPAASPAGGTGTAQIRLLLVEDHADTARTLSRLLRREGFAVVTAGDVAGAIAGAEREPFDLLVSDLGLPDGSGFDIMRAVRERRMVPGIAMSGYGMAEDIRRSNEAGFTEHLVKPINMPQLLAAIRRVTENRG